MRPPRGRISTIACLGLLLASPSAKAQTVTGTVKDARTGSPVMGALIELGLTEHYGVSWEDGSFALEAPDVGGTRTFIISAPGYAKRYEPVDLDGGRSIAVRLFPDPIDLEGIEATVVTYKTRLRRRLNRSTSRWYALEGTLLEMSREENVWDLVANRQGIRYDGRSDYGCPGATLHGRSLVVALYVDDRPVLMDRFLELRPQELARVEVVGFGSQMRAYTQEYLDWMTDNDYVAPAFETEFTMCPPTKPPPGTRKRGRPVGR